MDMATWSYRVVRRVSADDSDEWYSIQEVYYDENKKATAQTMDLQVEGDSLTGMRIQLDQMLSALGEPVLEESDIVDADDLTINLGGMEQRVSMLEMENDELRDRLDELRESVDEFRGASERHNRVSDLSGEEIDGMYTDDEMEEWGVNDKKKDNQSQEKTL